MSRIAKNAVPLPKGVTASREGEQLVVKGAKGTLSIFVPSVVEVSIEDGKVQVTDDRTNPIRNMQGGTMRANIANMVTGVSSGFERKLSLVGVGYRAQMKEGALSLSLGFSHPVEYRAPEGVTIETPTQTEIVVRGCDKQKVGQVAANIRAYRPPEPYKGKGVRYSNEVIIKKEAKKK